MSFIDNYEIVSYRPNDNTGFAATLFKDLITNE